MVVEHSCPHLYYHPYHHYIVMGVVVDLCLIRLEVVDKEVLVGVRRVNPLHLVVVVVPPSCPKLPFGCLEVVHKEVLVGVGV